MPLRCVQVAGPWTAKRRPGVAKVGGFEHPVFAQIQHCIVVGVLDEGRFPVALGIGSFATSTRDVGEVVVGVNSVKGAELIRSVKEPSPIVIGVFAHIDFEPIGTAHVLPFASVQKDGAVVLQSGTHLACLVLAHTNLVHLADAHSIGDVAVGDPHIG